MSGDHVKDNPPGCQAGVDPFGECCCTCRNRLPAMHHCTTSPEAREGAGGCCCGQQKGWVCIDPEKGVVYGDWPEHGIACARWGRPVTWERLKEICDGPAINSEAMDRARERSGTPEPTRGPTQRTLQRVRYLADPKTLDLLLDEFQENGMPMGSDRWAEHCLLLLKQRGEESSALRKVMVCIQEAQSRREDAHDGLWIEKRRSLEEHNREAELEGYSS